MQRAPRRRRRWRTPSTTTTSGLRSCDVAKTIPGEAESSPHTQYETPASSVPVAPPSSHPVMRPVEPRAHAAPAARDRSAAAVALGHVLACFLLAVVFAGIYAWKTGASAATTTRHATSRATAAMFQNHFSEPPGENAARSRTRGLRGSRTIRSSSTCACDRRPGFSKPSPSARGRRARGAQARAPRPRARSERRLDEAPRRAVRVGARELQPSAAPTLSPPPSSRPWPALRAARCRPHASSTPRSSISRPRPEGRPDGGAHRSRGAEQRRVQRPASP